MKNAGVIAAVLAILLCSAPAGVNAGPIGYPWSTWGELSNSWNGIENGFKADFYIEQGVDWFRISGTEWKFNTFIAGRVVQSDNSKDYWNNKIGPWFGFKFKHPVELFSGNWGEISIGARGEYYYFTGSNAPQNDDIRAVVFLQWSFGGDWSK
jgi:hypothetical protein